LGTQWSSAVIYYGHFDSWIQIKRRTKRKNPINSCQSLSMYKKQKDLKPARPKKTSINPGFIKPLTDRGGGLRQGIGQRNSQEN
jgi:hypothetical protein